MIRKYKNRRLPRGIIVDRGLVYIRIEPKGKVFQQCFGSASLPSSFNIAAAKLAEYREAIRNDKFGFEQKAKRITFRDAVQLFLNNKTGVPYSYRSAFLALRQFIGDDTWFDELMPVKMESYRDWSKLNRSVKRLGVTRPISDSNINRELTALSRLYHWLKEQCDAKAIEPLKLPEMTPCKNVEKFDERLSRRKRVLSQEEFQQFMQVAKPRVRLIVLGALNTALRKKDLLSLNKHNIVDYADELHGEQSKTGAGFVVPMNDNVKMLFNEKGENVLDATNFRREFEASRKIFIEKTGAEHFQFRDLRRTALRKVWDETKDIILCRDLAGHADVRTTQIYLGLTTKETRIAGEVMGRAFSFTTESKPSSLPSVTEKQIGFRIDKEYDNE